eukprot:CAMPEP_0202454766 /NCGR_PEP_ID=MMETSP1360-20130828/12419_1 /ASSEMBLY_ACC=CAM_ASM_000848 /TAXON_ID=515479 /ORGANISM="Licmophora paradoxa, Strain CCMP2313" /LENGTH=390 /DNA_ID=CAMNT_0049074171 /DNA_START=302 /DNA_END=1474 /DNA_ORIENTATION=+
MAVAVQGALPIYGKQNMQHKLADVKADSKLGQTLLSKARKLEQDAEVDFTWVAGFSIKFQGCHHISQWNGEADGDEDVKIATKRLVRFRLCPTGYCSKSDAGGCDSGYGDYIIDMNTYLEAYFQAVENNQQYMCEYMEKMSCGCDDDDGKDDGFDEDICLWDCYAAAGMAEICMDKNPYNDDEEEEGEQFEVREYVECAEAKFEENDDNNRRKLEEEEVQYFIGPYCAEQGGAIYLGLFTDDVCTVFADSYGGASTYKTLSYGESLPYSSSSVVGKECISCKEPEEVDENNDGNDEQDEDEVVEMCEEIYATAGKCESDLGIDNANTAACNYMEGIKIVRKDGTVQVQSSKANKTASIFIGLFVVSFVLLAAYVYFLHTKLQRASINLSE